MNKVFLFDLHTGDWNGSYITVLGKDEQHARDTVAAKYEREYGQPFAFEHHDLELIRELPVDVADAIFVHYEIN